MMTRITTMLTVAVVLPALIASGADAGGHQQIQRVQVQQQYVQPVQQIQRVQVQQQYVQPVQVQEYVQPVQRVRVQRVEVVDDYCPPQPVPVQFRQTSRFGQPSRFEQFGQPLGGLNLNVNSNNRRFGLFGR